MEGPLCKWTNVMKGWQYRYFVLDDNAGLLSYYTSKEKMIKGDRRGCVRLKGAVIGIDGEDDSTFTITVDGKMFHFQAHDAEERSKWVSGLEDTIRRFGIKARPRPRPGTSSHQVPTLSEFERKLTETDAYLQLIIAQVEDIDVKIESSSTESETQKLVGIKAKTLTLLEGIKHTIVLLQIAKNTVAPVNGITSGDSPPRSDGDLPKRSATSSVTSEGSDYKELSSGGFSSNAPRSVSSTRSDCEEKSDDDNASLTLRPDVAPVSSYSSSDDDDFYDAYEMPSPTSLANSPQGSGHCVDSATARRMTLDSVSVGKSPPPDAFDYDAMYEDDEEELGSLEGQGSVISHLISQVKIGMDLTKVVLPTFILERRSLLEMYADFFAHPDLFISIAEPEQPQERFIQAVKWYLSAFHAGRKSSVAKKPYNPILGETFKCHWDVPGYRAPTTNNAASVEANSSLLADGPVPWAGAHNLTFSAEQVSHHPPISAFYAEHLEKRIMCSAHIYTKSKFLGLSIGVHNLGQASIYLLDHGEEYTCTFPSAYGRSILTVPWVELGGATTITCPQTGYVANIEFLTKPFYGGKKHRVSGDVLGPNKKPILSVSGEWNGVMHAKWAASGKSEVFIDTKAIPIIKKKVQPVAKQDEFDSRRLWKDVTLALKMQDVNLATSAKFTIEQKQRELVKERHTSGQKWENRVFHSLGENWHYNTPLTQRQSKSSYKQ